LTTSGTESLAESGDKIVPAGDLASRARGNVLDSRPFETRKLRAAILPILLSCCFSFLDTERAQRDGRVACPLSGSITRSRWHSESRADGEPAALHLRDLTIASERASERASELRVFSPSLAALMTRRFHFYERRARWATSTWDRRRVYVCVCDHSRSYPIVKFLESRPRDSNVYPLSYPYIGYFAIVSLFLSFFLSFFAETDWQRFGESQTTVAIKWISFLKILSSTISCGSHFLINRFLIN